MEMKMTLSPREFSEDSVKIAPPQPHGSGSPDSEVDATSVDASTPVCGREGMTSCDCEPPFDDELAESYRGKSILVGVTYLDASGNVSSQHQFHGIIESASALHGIRIALRGIREGEVWTMPPSADNLRPAPPGTYTLRSTGERVHDPDLLATWDVVPGQISE
jgi:hypothetical protein